MNILICTGIFPPESGGPATYTAILADALSKRGHSVSVVTYGERPLSRRYSFPVTMVKRSIFKPLHYFRYFRAARKNGAEADVIYAQDPVSAGYPASLAARSLKKPFGRIRDMQIRTCRSADAIITPSEYLKKIVIGWGIKETKPRVIYNAISSLPDIERDRAREELGFGKDEFVIFSAGRPVPWKGFAMLQEVAADLRREDTGYRLVILNKAPRPEILKHLRACDAFVLNSGYEGFAFILLEAAAMEAPIITTTAGANPEVIRDGENGLLIEYNNREQIKTAILKLKRDPELRSRLVGEAEKLLEVFAEERMINETEGVLQQCAS